MSRVWDGGCLGFQVSSIYKFPRPKQLRIYSFYVFYTYLLRSGSEDRRVSGLGSGQDMKTNAL